jgi:hypothetical protein
MAVAKHFNYAWLFPLLERPRAHVTRDLQGSLDSLSLKQPPTPEEVSLRELVATALSSEDRWASLAAGWLESGFPLDVGLVKGIEQGIRLKKWERTTRHRLFQIVHRYRSK